MDTELLKFIKEHANDDTTRLLLSKGKWPEIDMDLAVNTIEGRRRIMSKVPAWGERFDLLYPTRLCTEQCSSTATAQYKASILERLFEGRKPRIADMTGGLGVDSWHFASVSEEVLYNEADKILSDSVKENFQTLGTMNIRTCNCLVEPGNVARVLGDFHPDIIFMDPARRSSAGKKVFLIEDCQPDVLSLKDEIFGFCRYLFLKLSPMADITMVVERLGHVIEVHTVSSGGECKELLILMDRENVGKHYKLFVHECGTSSGSLQTLEFESDEEREALITLPEKHDLSKLYLFEPNKALSKAGVFNTLCQRFGMVRLGRSTNLYLIPQNVCLYDGHRMGNPGIGTFGKIFRIAEDLPLDNRTIKALGKRIGWADVTARNIPMDSEALSKKLSLNPKNATAVIPHIFGIRIDWRDSTSESRLLVTERC